MLFSVGIKEDLNVPEMKLMDDYIERLDFPYMTSKNHFISPLNVLLEKKNILGTISNVKENGDAFWEDFLIKDLSGKDSCLTT